MKKIYLFSMVLVASVGAIAQPIGGTCPSTLSAISYTVPTVPTFCKMFVAGGPKTYFHGAVVSLVAVGGAVIKDLNNNPFTYLDANGGATIDYNCTFVDHIDIDYFIVTSPGDTTHFECLYRPAQGASLPIKLTSLTGRLQTDNSVALDWTSAIEEDSYQYQVQRSADGKNYQTVGTLTAAGTSLDLTKYNFVDQLPAAGSYFYRLNMVDKDGKSELSKVVYVNSKKGAGVVTKVFPNPFTSEIQLIGATSANMTPGKIHMFSISGQAINFRIVGANAIAIDPSLPMGTYILQVKDDINVQTFKVQKIN
jgi:hypothetical protein